MSRLDNLTLLIEQNDLLSMSVEAIVCPVTVGLERYGNISQKLFSLGQGNLLNDLSELRTTLPNNKLLLGQAISLDCKPTYNIGQFKKLIFVALWCRQSEYNLNLCYKAYINSFRQAFRYGLKTIALPIMAYRGNLDLCGQAVIKVIRDLDSLKTSSDFPIEEIYFVSTNVDHVAYFEDEALASPSKCGGLAN